MAPPLRYCAHDMKFDTLRIRIVIVAILGALVCILAAWLAWYYYQRTSEPLAGPLQFGEYMPLLPLIAMASVVLWLAFNVRRQWSRPSGPPDNPPMQRTGRER